MKYAGNVIYNSEANWESDDYAPSGLCTGSVVLKGSIGEMEILEGEGNIDWLWGC